jgi:hypothetical protein
MGKTLPPFSTLIEQERRRWIPLKKALPTADQALFDRLFDCAKRHVQAGVSQSRPLPLETMIIAILLEQQKLLERAQRLLADLQSRKQV